MVSMTTLPADPFTRSDLDAMPDDGHRYELVDAACPEDLEALFAPFDVVISDDTVMQPDLLVARRTDVTSRDLPRPPLLAVEILSPSTRRIDLTLKRARYEAAGTPSYWVVDPDELTLTAWELADGRYAESAQVTGEETFSTTSPFPVDIVPARLRD